MMDTKAEWCCIEKIQLYLHGVICDFVKSL